MMKAAAGRKAKGKGKGEARTGSNRGPEPRTNGGASRAAAGREPAKMVRRSSIVVAADIEHLLKVRGVAPLPFSEISFEGVIGKGRFKEVSRGTLRLSDGQTRRIVVSRYPRKTDVETNELEILALLAEYTRSSEYVPELLGACDELGATYVVQERAKYGSLKTALTDPEIAPRITPAHKIKVCADLSRAMDFLQSARVVHNDLACRNALVHRLEEDPNSIVAKITDLGLALVLPKNIAYERLRQPQAVRWCAPEVVADSRLSHKADVWSLGATMWELYADGTAPWALREKRADVAQSLRDLAAIAAAPAPESDLGIDDSGASSAAATVAGEFPAPEGCIPQVHKVILSCMEVRTETRPTFMELAERLDAILAEVAPRRAVSEDGEEQGEVSPTGEDVGKRPSLQMAEFFEEALKEAVVEKDEAPTPTVEDFYTPNQPAGTPALSSPDSGRVRRAIDPVDPPPGGIGNRRLGTNGSWESGLQVLDRFLQSPHAEELLGDDTLEAIKGELETLQQRKQADPTTASQASVVGTPNDHLLRLSPVDNERRWTLWSLADSQHLRRQTFTSLADAWEAYRAAGDIPRSLRSPDDEDVAEHSWFNCANAVPVYPMHPASAGVSLNVSAAPPSLQGPCSGYASPMPVHSYVPAVFPVEVSWGSASKTGLSVHAASSHGCSGLYSPLTPSPLPRNAITPNGVRLDHTRRRSVSPMYTPPLASRQVLYTHQRLRSASPDATPRQGSLPGVWRTIPGPTAWGGGIVAPNAGGFSIAQSAREGMLQQMQMTR